MTAGYGARPRWWLLCAALRLLAAAPSPPYVFVWFEELRLAGGGQPLDEDSWRAARMVAREPAS
jgi:hypothetical protein